MNTGIENRRHPRMPLNWPVIFMTPQGSIFRETSNISASGALILCPYTTKNDDEFQIFLTPHGYHYMPVNCKKTWSSDFLSNEFFYIAFRRISKITNYEKDVMIIMVYISQFIVLFPIKFS